jgi:hypothetical protein
VDLVVDPNARGIDRSGVVDPLGPHGETHRQIAAEVGGGKTLGQAVAAGLAIEKSFIGRGDDGRADGDGCRAARGVEKKTASAVVIGVFVDIIIVFTDDVVTDVILTDSSSLTSSSSLRQYEGKCPLQFRNTRNGLSDNIPRHVAEGKKVPLETRSVRC